MKLLKILSLIVVIGLVAVAATVGGVYFYGNTKFEAAGPVAADGGIDTVILVERGMGVSSIAARLEELGLISRARLFSIGVRLAGHQNDLKAGEYAIPSEASMADIMGILQTGDSISHWITIPEGLANLQIAEIIAANDILTGEMPEMPGEGEVLPETYDFLRGTSRTEVVARMAASMDETLAELWEARAEDTLLASPYEALILASIVQKETGVAQEIPLVASVFVNRLRIGYRLQSDPTIIYGLTQGVPLGRRIRQSELDRVTAYNTYHIDRLPPTPIAAPGRAAIEAVLNPPDTDYLYFVADGTGGHAFARSIQEHNQNVAAWRRVQREQGLR